MSTVNLTLRPSVDIVVALKSDPTIRGTIRSINRSSVFGPVLWSYRVYLSNDVAAIHADANDLTVVDVEAENSTRDDEFRNAWLDLNKA